MARCMVVCSESPLIENRSSRRPRLIFSDNDDHYKSCFETTNKILSRENSVTSTGVYRPIFSTEMADGREAFAIHGCAIFDSCRRKHRVPPRPPPAFDRFTLPWSIVLKRCRVIRRLWRSTRTLMDTDGSGARSRPVFFFLRSRIPLYRFSPRRWIFAPRRFVNETNCFVFFSLIFLSRYLGDTPTPWKYICRQ